MGGAFSSRPEPTINDKNHHISWFNSTFEKAEITLNNLTNELFNNGNSKINIFNHFTIFNIIENLNNHINLLNVPNNGEPIILIKKYKIILNYLFQLYSTELTKFENYDLNNFDNFNNISRILNENMRNINNSRININSIVNQYINNNNNNLDAIFNNDFLRNNNIIQYLRLLLDNVTCLENEVNSHIRYFNQENRNWFGFFYHNSLGCFANLSRNGYSYAGTANFYTYWLNNNIRIIRETIQDKINLIEAIIDRTIIQEQQNILIHGHLSNFNKKVDNFDYHIIENLTDNLTIIFMNNNTEINVSINIGNYIIPSYEDFILKLNNQINEELHNNENNSEIKFLMRYESMDIELLSDVDDILNPPVNQILQNNVILRCNVPFQINNKSGILQLIGWDSFNDVHSLVNHETNIHSCISTRVLYNEQINVIINKNSRMTELINLLNVINLNMGKHNVNLNN
jgi:hypothetical protein